MSRRWILPIFLFGTPAAMVSVWSSWRLVVTAAPILIAWATLLFHFAARYWWPGRRLASVFENWNLGRSLLVWFILAGPVSLVLGKSSSVNLAFWAMLVLTMILSWILGGLSAREPGRLLRDAGWIWLIYLGWYFTLGVQYLDRHPYQRNGMFAVGLGAGLAGAWGFRNPWLRYGILALGLWLAWLTEQRTGLVAAALCVLWVLFWLAMKRMKAWRGLLAPGLVVLLLVVLLLWPMIWEGISNVLLLHDPVRGVGTGLTGRTRIWALALVKFLQSPWFGHGPGANRIIMYEVIMGQRTAHNGILSLLVDYGVFGALPGVLLFLLAVRRGLKAFWSRGELAWLGWTSLIVFILVYSLGENYWFGFSNQTSLLGLMALGLIFEHRKGSPGAIAFEAEEGDLEED